MLDYKALPFVCVPLTPRRTAGGSCSIDEEATIPRLLCPCVYQGILKLLGFGDLNAILLFIFGYHLYLENWKVEVGTFLIKLHYTFLSTGSKTRRQACRVESSWNTLCGLILTQRSEIQNRRLSGVNRT